MKVVTKETNFISDLKLDIPLTPNSTRKSTVKYEQESLDNFRNLKSSFIPQTPESPGNNPVHIMNRLENELFQETYSAESSLRLPPPQLPPVSPKQNIFPVSMFGIYIADEGLHCHEIARSVIDSINDEIKWQTFVRPSMTIDRWPEEVEGEWEDFVDYTGSTFEREMVILRRTIMEDEEVLEMWNGDPRLPSPDKRKEFLDVLEIVRKRKSIEGHGREAESDIQGDRGWKRSRWSQKNCIREFMQSRGQHFSDFTDEEVPEKVMIRNPFFSGFDL